jgi:hypothetical protein
MSLHTIATAAMKFGETKMAVGGEGAHPELLG